jgi:hypothetical protein
VDAVPGPAEAEEREEVTGRPWAPGPAAAAAGDIAGFGVGSKFAWQLVAVLEYGLNPRTALRFTYRYPDTDYRKDDFVFDTPRDGFLLGGTLKLLDAKTTTVAKD